TEVHDFFKRHEIFLTEHEWISAHASDQLHDLLADYAERVKSGWKVKFYFVSTGRASDRTRELVESMDRTVKLRTENVSFELYDFYGLKELYTRSRSIEAPISPFVDIQFPEGRWLLKEEPHDTLLAVVKGNALVNLYRKERDSLFAHNIRSFLGKRV